MKFKSPKFAIKFTGDFKFHQYPPFFVYKPHHYAVKGETVRKVLEEIKFGDILLRRYDWYLSTALTPGYWGHCAIYVGGNNIIHSIGSGATREDILTFCRTDAITIQRIVHPDYSPLLGGSRKTDYEILVNKAVAFAEKILGTPYDYDFVIGDGIYTCAEVINAGYKPLFEKDYERVAGQWVITPDGIYRSKASETIFEFRS